MWFRSTQQMAPTHRSASIMKLSLFYPSSDYILLLIYFRCDESLPFDLEGDQQGFINISNINDRHLDMSSILDDLGLKEYKSLFEIEEVNHFVNTLDASINNVFQIRRFQIDFMAFLLLTDGDLQEIGVKDGYHRQIFTGTIEKFNLAILN